MPESTRADPIIALSRSLVTRYGLGKVLPKGTFKEPLPGIKRTPWMEKGTPTIPVSGPEALMWSAIIAMNQLSGAYKMGAWGKAYRDHFGYDMALQRKLAEMGGTAQSVMEIDQNTGRTRIINDVRDIAPNSPYDNEPRWKQETRDWKRAERSFLRQLYKGDIPELRMAGGHSAVR